MEGVDVSKLDFMWKVGLAVFGMVGSVCTMWLSLNFVRKSDMEKFTKALHADQLSQNDRIDALELRLQDVPRHSDMEALVTRVGDLTSRVANMEGQTDRNNNLLQAIHDHLLNKRD